MTCKWKYSSSLNPVEMINEFMKHCKDQSIRGSTLILDSVCIFFHPLGNPSVSVTLSTHTHTLPITSSYPSTGTGAGLRQTRSISTGLLWIALLLLVTPLTLSLTQRGQKEFWLCFAGILKARPTSASWLWFWMKKHYNFKSCSIEWRVTVYVNCFSIVCQL